MAPQISFPIALLLSLCIHAAALVLPFFARQREIPPKELRPLEIQLPPEETLDPASHVSTEVIERAKAPVPPPAAGPTLARGRTLQRTQSALAKHLLYPPEAVARGIEGEVMLLLILDAGSRIASAEIARSSGHAILDDAALKAARSITALPGNPRQTLLPVRFRLD
jgi:protein TonB